MESINDLKRKILELTSIYSRRARTAFRPNGDDLRLDWEKDSLKKLFEQNELISYKDNGFWQPMDYLRDKNKLNEMWENDNEPWKLWK